MVHGAVEKKRTAPYLHFVSVGGGFLLARSKNQPGAFGMLRITRSAAEISRIARR